MSDETLSMTRQWYMHCSNIISWSRQQSHEVDISSLTTDEPESRSDSLHASAHPQTCESRASTWSTEDQAVNAINQQKVKYTLRPCEDLRFVRNTPRLRTGKRKLLLLVLASSPPMSSVNVQFTHW